MNRKSKNLIKEKLSEEVSLFSMWLRSLRGGATRHLPGLRSAEGDVRGGRGLTETDAASSTIALPVVESSEPFATVTKGEPQSDLLPSAELSLLLEFGVKLAQAPQRVLMLDYDGTLAPFKEARLEAVPYPGVRELISEIIAKGDRVIIISGRLSSDVATLLGVDPPPEIWGCHGWEKLVNGELVRFPLSPNQQERIVRAGFTLKNEGFQSRLEYKHGSVALHWRGASDKQHADILRAGVRAMDPAIGNDLMLHRFDGGLELRATGRDKGYVVREILQEFPDTIPTAYLGDDATDEDAFRALEGRGLGILVRTELRETAAAVWLKPPDELIDFLTLWANTAKGKSQ